MANCSATFKSIDHGDRGSVFHWNLELASLADAGNEYTRLAADFSWADEFCSGGGPTDQSDDGWRFHHNHPDHDPLLLYTETIYRKHCSIRPQRMMSKLLI